MDRDVTRLFPAPSARMALRGLYLGHGLHKRGSKQRPFVFSNFVSSLDGRIGVTSAGHTTHTVPAAIANPRDWRLYQELAGQADLLVTSGRYFRQSAQGEAQDRLPVGAQDEFADIRNWRLQQGLAAQPDIAIMSASLDIPPQSLQPYRSRRILVITGAAADKTRLRELEQLGVGIILAGNGHQVDGRRMISQLGQSGYRSIYSIAGPAVFTTLLQAGRMDRLYLTLACTLLGGEIYDTLTRGGQLTPPVNMQLAGLCHDPWAPEHAGQLLAYFEPAR